MGSIGGLTKLRIDGCEEHDVGSIQWKRAKPKTPFTPLGKKGPTQYQSGVKDITWSAEVEPKPGGTYAIDWDTWLNNDGEKTLVIVDGARTERLIAAVVDELDSNHTRNDGKKVLKVSGKARDHAWS